MADKKITELTEVTSLPDAALLTGVDTTRAAGDRNVSIQKSNLIPASSTQDLEDVIAQDPTATSVPDFENGLSYGNGTIALLTIDDGVGTIDLSSAAGRVLTHATALTLSAPRTQAGNGDIVAIATDKYNATTNSPTLSNTNTNRYGLEYEVSVAGIQDFGAGSITIGVGDILANDGTIWYKKVDNNQSGGSGGSSTQYMVRNLSDLTTNLTVGTTVEYFRLPFGANLTGITCSLLDAGTITGVTVDMLVNGVSILSTLLTTDATEKTSTTATTPAVISTSLIPYDAEITFDIDGVPTAGKGLIVNLELEPV